MQRIVPLSSEQAERVSSEFNLPFLQDSLHVVLSSIAKLSPNIESLQIEFHSFLDCSFSLRALNQSFDLLQLKTQIAQIDAICRIGLDTAQSMLKLQEWFYKMPARRTHFLSNLHSSYLAHLDHIVGIIQSYAIVMYKTEIRVISIYNLAPLLATNSLNSFTRRIQQLTSISESYLIFKQCEEFNLIVSDLERKANSSHWILLIQNNSILRDNEEFKSRVHQTYLHLRKLKLRSEQKKESRKQMSQFHPLVFLHLTLSLNRPLNLIINSALKTISNHFYPQEGKQRRPLPQIVQMASEESTEMNSQEMDDLVLEQLDCQEEVKKIEKKNLQKEHENRKCLFLDVQTKWAQWLARTPQISLREEIKQEQSPLRELP